MHRAMVIAHPLKPTSTSNIQMRAVSTINAVPPTISSTSDNSIHNGVCGRYSSRSESWL
jgi:hypothetical protein